MPENVNASGFDGAHAMIASLAGPGLAPAERIAARERDRAQRAQLLDTPVPCTPDPASGRCLDMNCPSCWLGEGASSPLRPDLSATDVTDADLMVSHTAWRAAWLPNLVRFLQGHILADRALREGADAARADELRAVGGDPRSTVADMARAMAPTAPTTLPLGAEQFYVWMCEESLTALRRLAEGERGSLTYCGWWYGRLRIELDHLAGGVDVTGGGGPQLDDGEASELAFGVGPAEEETP